MAQDIQVIKREINSVRAALEKMQPQFLPALAGTGITPERLLRVAMTTIQNNPKLLDCDRTSLFSAVMSCAQLGLEPDGILGQAYLIPFGNKVQFIAGYRGLLSLARRSGDVTSILAKEVYENDSEWDVDYSILPPAPPFRHKPLLKGVRGEIVAVWALARFTDGSFHWDYMTVSEVEAIRDNSKGYQSAVAWSKNPKNRYSQGVIESPWVSSFPEMAKKTIIRRIAKYLPMSVQKAAFIEDRLDAGKATTFDNETGELILNDAMAEAEGGDDDNTPPSGGGKLDKLAASEPAKAEAAAEVSTEQKHEPDPSPPAVDSAQSAEALTGEVLPPEDKKPQGVSVAKIELKNFNLATVQGCADAAKALEKIMMSEPMIVFRKEIFAQSEGDRLVKLLTEKGMGAQAASLLKVSGQ